MQNHHVKIKDIQHVTHDVLRIVTEKPPQFNFLPGQATELSINKEGWQSKKRPFLLLAFRKMITWSLP